MVSTVGLVFIVMSATLQAATGVKQECSFCTGPLPQLHQIMAGNTVVYYHNLTSNNLIWCKSGNQIFENVNADRTEFSYVNPSTNDNYFTLYLINETEAGYCWNTSYVNKKYLIKSDDEEICASLIVIQVVEEKAPTTEINCNISTQTATSTEGVTSNSPNTTDIAGTNHTTTKGTDMTSTITKGTELTSTDHRTTRTPSLNVTSALKITPEVIGSLGGVVGLFVGLVAGVLLATCLFHVFCECKTSKQSTYLNEIPPDTRKDFFRENEHYNSKTEDDYGIQKP